SEQARLRNQMERLITAYQDGLLTLEQLRERMPNLKQQSQAVNSELQFLEMAKLDQAKYLKLAESLGGFRNKLRARAQTLDVKERQQILRLLVKEILVGFDTLTIRHSIPIPSGDGPPPNSPRSTPNPPSDYPLRPRCIHARSREALEALLPRRQPGHRRRSDAEEFRASKAAGRGIAGAAAVLAAARFGRDEVGQEPSNAAPSPHTPIATAEKGADGANQNLRKSHYP
ncbi:MAG TPA: hypothetical protein VIH91_09545, partial [Terriglobales bacterium]